MQLVYVPAVGTSEAKYVGMNESLQCLTENGRCFNSRSSRMLDFEVFIWHILICLPVLPVYLHLTVP